MNFGQAIEALKAGKKVSRSGWNGKGMWVVLMPALYLPPANSNEIPRVNERLVMWTAAQQWQPGWLASQADMLAEDWGIVE